MRSIIDALQTDVRQALRRIRRSPGLSVVVVVTLAMAISANTTILALLKPTVLQKLATPNPDALVSITATDARTGITSSLHLPVLNALQDAPRSFSQMAAFVSSIARVESGSVSLDVGVEGVTPEYFSVLGVRPKTGRVLLAGDDPFMGAAVITERLGRRLFGDADPVGKAILVGGRSVDIVGVAPPQFIGVRMDGGDELFLPLAYLRFTQSGDRRLVPRAQELVGRLAPGVTIEEARAEMIGRWPAVQAAVAAQLPSAQQPVVNNQRLKVESFARGFSGLRSRYGRSLVLVMGLAVSLLAVACVNLGGLMLARSLTRQHEFAVRIALGVSRIRLIQQTIIDGLLLSIAALVIAFPIFRWMTAVLISMVSVGRVMPIGDASLDPTVLILATAVTIAIGLMIGLLPAHQALTGAKKDLLRGRGIAQGIRGSARAVLTAQIALSMILVVGSGLFVHTLSNLYANDLQQRPNPILFTRLARNPLERATPLRQAYFQNLQQQLGSVPGANLAALSVFYPAYMGFFDPMPMDTVWAGEGLQASAVADAVTPGFFDLYSIARLRGRDFTWLDNDEAPKVGIVNDALARKLSASADVVGRHVRVTSGTVTNEVEIVGIVADATVSNIRERHVPALYRPLMQDLTRGQNPMAHVSVTGDVSSAQRGYVDAVNRLGQHFVLGMFTMDDFVDNAVVEQQLIAGMASFAATLALSLSCLGLFGLLAYSVASRAREIGVRMSIGATPPEIVRMIMRESVVVVVPGLAIGVPLALAAAWTLRSQLHGVSPTDPWTIAGACALFVVTAAIAALLPAHRASRIEPTEALRQD